jgi:hypothetical protein
MDGVLRDSHCPSASCVFQPDRAGTTFSGNIADGTSPNNEPDLQSQEPEHGCQTWELPPRSLEHVLTGLADDTYLPAWMQGIQGLRFILKASHRFQELGHFKKSAETGQAVAVDDANPLERDALFLQLAVVAGPFGWQDEYTEYREGDFSTYVPRDMMLPLLEGATTHLAAINWGWEHALPTAAFLTFCIARILDDKRVSQVIDQLPPGEQELSLMPSQELVRSSSTLCVW